MKGPGPRLERRRQVGKGSRDDRPHLVTPEDALVESAQEGERRRIGSHLRLPRTRSAALSHTSSNISSVSFPVNVFCWLG